MEITLTASKLKDILNCYRSYFYFNLYSERNEIPISSEKALGQFFHSKIEKFWIMNKKSKLPSPKYKTKDSFANAARGNFTHNVILTEEIKKRKINWRSEQEKWIAREELTSMCLNIYERLAEEGPPILVEQPFEFTLEGITFRGKIDEVRKGDSKNLIAIRDYKTGRFIPKEPRLERDFQFTIYVLGLGCLAYGRKDFAELLEIDDEIRQKWAGNPIYLDERIRVEYYHVRTNEIITTKRNDAHYAEFIKRVSKIRRSIMSIIGEKTELYPWDFPVNTDYCKYCDASAICDAHEDKKETPARTEIKNDLFLGFELDSDIVVSEVKLKTIKMPKKQQIKSRRQTSLF